MAVKALGGEIVEISAVSGEKVVQPVVIAYVKLVPLVEPRPFELLVINDEAHGPHQVEPRAGDGAGAGYVAGVLGDLGLDENDV